MSKDELAGLGDWGKCHRRGAEAEAAEACGAIIISRDHLLGGPVEPLAAAWGPTEDGSRAVSHPQALSLQAGRIHQVLQLFNF